MTQAEQIELFPSMVTQLNQTRGVIDVEQLDGFEYDPDKRLNLPMLAGQIGVALSTVPRAGQEDLPLELYRSDFVRADLDGLRGGLIIPPDSSLYKKPEANRIAIIRSAPVSIMRIKGVQKPDVGVALGVGEYQKIAHFPGPLARAMKARTLDARADNLDREANRAASMRAAGHVLVDKQESLWKLEERFVGHVALFGSLYKDARLVWRTSYLGKNLDRKRRQADELIHDYIEIAANNLEYSTAETNAVHRAIVSELYRSGSASDLAAKWRSITKWAALYVNAKRGKVNQSMNGCAKELRKYQMYLDAKAKAEAI